VNDTEIANATFPKAPTVLEYSMQHQVAEPWRALFFILASILGVSGCSGGAAAPASAIPSAVTRTSSSRMDDAARAQTLVFVGASSGSRINIYSRQGKEVGQISQIGGGSITADSSGTLYVPATTSSEFYILPKPYTEPPTIIADSGQYPVDVAVDSKTGLIAVVNILTTSDGPPSVRFYEQAAKKPCATVGNKRFSKLYFAAFDASGILYVDGTGSSGQTAVGEVAGGCKAESITALKTSNHIAFPGGVAVNAADQVCIEDQQGASIDTYARQPNGSLELSETTPLAGASDPVTFAFAQDGKHLWSVDAGLGTASEFPYPAGGPAEVTISGVGGGIAVTPIETP